MSDKSKLLVPMYMQALVLKEDKKDCLDLSPNLISSDEKKLLLGKYMQPDLTEEAKLEKGIHLHWTLPGELTHAFVDDNEEVNFPFVPNKWLVTRIQTNQDITNLPARLWIVESDSKNADDEKSNLIIIKDSINDGVETQQLEFVAVGKVSPLTAEKSNELIDIVLDSPVAPILKAVVQGNPNFASFYPGCRNVFGFHDDMADIINTDCTLTYIVTGWYSDPSADPLDPLHFDGEPNDQQKKRKRELDWFRKQWKYESKDYPTSTLLHSSIHSIKWNNQVSNADPRGDVKVFTANTSIEALSTQISKRFSENQKQLGQQQKEEELNRLQQAGIEELLNALQFELLEDEVNLPGMAAIKNEIHKRGFTPKTGGSFWEVTRVETNNQQMEAQEERRLPFPNDPNLLNTLKHLNAQQTKLNKINLEIASLQQEYYFLWYKKAYQVTGILPVKVFNYDDSRKLTLNEINNRKSAAIKLKAEVEDKKKQVIRHKELSGSKPEFELKQKLEDRFWEPNEPVLLLTGTGVGNTDKQDFNAGNKATNCRTLDRVVKQLQLPFPSLESEKRVTISSSSFSVPNIRKLENPNIPVEEVKALVYETLLLDQSLADEIAWLAYQAAGEDLNRTKDSRVVTKYGIDTIAEFQKEFLKGNVTPLPNETDVQPPAPYAIRAWTEHWSPLFMAWEVECFPDTLGEENKDLLENTTSWILEDGLFFKNQRSETSNRTLSMQGISTLSTTVLTNLNRVLPKELMNAFGEQNKVAQTLSGFHKFLLMQRPDIQLPPLKYKQDRSTDFFVDKDELRQIGTAGYRFGSNPGDIEGKDPNLFFPLRSGLMKVTNLSIVDVFGRVKRVLVNDEDNAITYPLSVKGVATDKSPRIIPLPPRILQPSRLLFHWLNAKDEVIYQDTGRLDIPVLGWLVPNYLDNSLMIYDGEGNDVAILQVTTDLSQENGLNLIKTPFPGMNEFPDLTTNPHLKTFLDRLDRGSKGSIVSALLDLALKINLNITGTNAVQINTGALLYGQPVALARCSVSLELMGLPAYNQRWDQSDKKNSGGIETVKVPLYIGDCNKEKDGLLGFFQNDDFESLYTTGNAPFKPTEPFFKTNLPVKVYVDQEPVKITLLLDPSAGVHISSGILPTKFVELYHNSSKELLSSLDISFMVAPFIAEKPNLETVDEKKGPGIPIPTSINANWKWVQKTDVKAWQKDTDIPEGKNKQGPSFKKLQVYEGWLRLSNLKKK